MTDPHEMSDRELSEAVAVEVLDLGVHVHPSTQITYCTKPGATPRANGQYNGEDQLPAPVFATDIAAAMEVFEWADGQDGWDVCLRGLDPQTERLWECVVGTPEKPNSWAWAEAWPGAPCRPCPCRRGRRGRGPARP